MEQESLKYNVPKSVDMGTLGAISLNLQRRIKETVAKRPLSLKRLRQIDDQWGNLVYIGLLGEYAGYERVDSTLVEREEVYIFKRTIKS